ncbi:MAG: hypothetical protein ABSG62_08980 [Terracidiphilus sp.]|jgi:hypothetical protein
MIFTLLQLAAIAAVAVCLYRWRASVRRRNTQSWESLLSRLQPSWGAHGLNDQFLWDKGLKATPEENWKRIKGPYGLWAIYQNARVMLEMADYAARNTASFDRKVLETLRSDATHIRVCVLKTLTQYALRDANESICANAFCATSMYTEMAARMTQLMRGSLGDMFPALAF